MSERKGLFTSIIGILFIIIIVSFFIRIPFMIMAPGIAQELSPMITVEEGYKNQSQGDFMLTAVSTQQATVWDYVYIKAKKPFGVELDPMSEHIPEGMNMVEYLEILEMFMEDSQNISKAVAFEKAGFKTEIKNNGVMVSEVLANGSAKGKLEKGDLIIAVDGQKIVEDQEAIDLIRNRQIGDEVTITVERDEKTLDFTMDTVGLDDDSEQPSIGVMIYTNRVFNFPREIKFHTDNIAGSSAGGMFALEIYNQLLREDITKGKRIAGTGTIDLDGKIGEIDGVEQKVLAAERKDADLFFVPIENYDSARKTATKIKLVSIETIDDAIQYLKQN